MLVKQRDKTILDKTDKDKKTSPTLKTSPTPKTSLQNKRSRKLTTPMTGMTRKMRNKKLQHEEEKKMKLNMKKWLEGRSREEQKIGKLLTRNNLTTGKKLI